MTTTRVWPGLRYHFVDQLQRIEPNLNTALSCAGYLLATTNRCPLGNRSPDAQAPARLLGRGRQRAEGGAATYWPMDKLFEMPWSSTAAFEDTAAGSASRGT